MNTPVYILAAVPAKPTRFANLFSAEADSLMKTLEHPGSFRYAGWSLETLDSAKIRGGEYLEVKNGDRKVIQLYEDGTLLVRVAADDSFLGWGRDEDEFKKQPRLNPMAVIELTASFVHLYAKLIPRLATQPQDLVFHLEVDHQDFEGRLYLLPHALHSISWISDHEKQPLDVLKVSKDLTVSAADVLTNPNEVAYRLVERFYLFFGLPSDKIPYTKQMDGKRIIDIETIAKQR